MSKVGNLMAKIDSSRKMAALMVKLYKKYPQVIQKVKDPQQEAMEQMMKEASEKAPEKEEEQEEEQEEEDLDDHETQEL